MKIDPTTFKPFPDAELIKLAYKPGMEAIEVSFIVHKGDYYHLFVSHDFCCKGNHSNYKIKVGRSKDITGPYVDRDNKPMIYGLNHPVHYQASEGPNMKLIGFLSNNCHN